MSSKEIAQQTGLTPQTVDTYVKAAMAKLRVDNRRDAARLFTAWEASQKSGSPSAGIVGDAETGKQTAMAAGGNWRELLAIPPVGGRENNLGAAAKTLAVLKVSIVGAVVLAALMLCIAGLLYTFR